MTDDEIVRRVMAAPPEKLDRLADAIQGEAFRMLAKGHETAADAGEQFAMMVRRLAEQKREGA